MSALALGTATAVAGLGYNIYNAESQKSKASDIESKLKDPIYTIPEEFKQNRALAQQMAQVGLPQQQYNNQANAIARNQAGGLMQLGRSANPGANIASVVRAGNDANNNLNAEDAAARQNNQRYFIQQNAALGGQELAKQQNDVFDKYTRNFNEAAALRGAGMQNENNAVNTATNFGLQALNTYAGSRTPTQTYGEQNGISPIAQQQMPGLNMNPNAQAQQLGVYRGPYQNQPYSAPYNSY